MKKIWILITLVLVTTNIKAQKMNKRYNAVFYQVIDNPVQDKGDIVGSLKLRKDGSCEIWEYQSNYRAVGTYRTNFVPEVGANYYIYCKFNGVEYKGTFMYPYMGTIDICIDIKIKYNVCYSGSSKQTQRLLREAN